MALPLEEYGLIGDTQTAALVGRNGSMDWLCLPRFDSGACFAALLGEPEHGTWQLSPQSPVRATRRAYQGHTLILETTLVCDEGEIRLVDFMPIRQRDPDVVRIVEGVRGDVAVRSVVRPRFDYGSVRPWVTERQGCLWAAAGPDSVYLRTPAETQMSDGELVSNLRVRPGDRVPFVLTWHPSFEPPPRPIDPFAALEDTASFWQSWAIEARCPRRWCDEVMRSLITLKALTFAPTGGIVAAPTTSLPECPGGVRNWDYRFCWLRDATFTLYALLLAGYLDEAHAWTEWLLRAVAGDPSQLQTMYGPAGERRLPELELPWLPGYARSRPVRVGNAAVNQLQLDVYGEVMDVLHQARCAGVPAETASWTLEKALTEFVADSWTQPDEGIWEVRGPRRHFTHSKVMAWVALDRAIRTIERFGLSGPLHRWREVRARIHRDVCERAFDGRRNTFTQSYGSRDLDAALLLIPLVGFLPPHDPRVVGTVCAIERELMHDGLLLRYPTHPALDGLPPGEGAFLACTFWLADNYALAGRAEEAEELFRHLLSLRNDLGLLSEQYDVRLRRQLGNFPQAFSHVALVNTARNLSSLGGPAHQRPGAHPRPTAPTREQSREMIAAH
jgi:GH15 family glucan-1,4-alpha-glucosidase